MVFITYCLYRLGYLTTTDKQIGSEPELNHNLNPQKDRYALSGVLSEIKIYFNVGNTEVAVLQTVFVIAYLAFAPLIGYLGDKLNRKYLIIIATLLEMTSVITGSFVQDSSKVIRPILGGSYEIILFYNIIIMTNEITSILQNYSYIPTL